MRSGWATAVCLIPPLLLPEAQDQRELCMKIAVLGGDGFVGWPTCLHLARRGHDIHIVDNLSRRWIDTELGVQSLTPMDSIQERLRIWRSLGEREIHFHFLNV